jgi:putative phosphoesterase
MRVGIFADSHDHLDHIRRAVKRFNEEKCRCVIFAGDLVSTIAVPPLRHLRCPLVGCFGDNEGNKVGLHSGLSIVGTVFQEPPIHYRAEDGTRFVVVHMKQQLSSVSEEFDVAVYGHTHKPRVYRDEKNRLFVNPGETSGWSFRRPTIALLDTETANVEIVELR